ncbi:MAG: putative DNA binding domain-containing protein [Bryobacteraceae bacterium]
MLSQEELEKILLDIESDRVERTTSMKDTDKFAQAVTAFANDLPNHRLPGYLIIGVDDRGNPSGLTVTDQLLQNLAALRSDGNIQPLSALSVAKFVFAGGQVAVVEVQPSDLPPVRYQGRVWILVGPRKATASEQEERILSEKRVSHAVTFDARPCSGSSLDDLSEDLFRTGYLKHAVAGEVLAENHRTLEEQLASLRFYDLKRQCPANAGVLLFGSDPLRWIPGAYVQFVRVDGPTLADDVVTETAISGDLLTVLRELDQLVHVNNATRPVAVSALREKQGADYPPVALRELIMNAMMHRSYEATGPVRISWL